MAGSGALACASGWYGYGWDQRPGSCQAQPDLRQPDLRSGTALLWRIDGGGDRWSAESKHGPRAEARGPCGILVPYRKRPRGPVQY